jgi:hypothetical protein
LGIDLNLTTVTKDVNNIYTITDFAGHTTKLFFQKTFLGKLLTFAKLTGMQYDTAVKVTLPPMKYTQPYREQLFNCGVFVLVI